MEKTLRNACQGLSGYWELAQPNRRAKKASTDPSRFGEIHVGADIAFILYDATTGTKIKVALVQAKRFDKLVGEWPSLMSACQKMARGTPAAWAWIYMLGRDPFDTTIMSARELTRVNRRKSPITALRDESWVMHTPEDWFHELLRCRFGSLALNSVGQVGAWLDTVRPKRVILIARGEGAESAFGRVAQHLDVQYALVPERAE